MRTIEAEGSMQPTMQAQKVFIAAATTVVIVSCTSRVGDNDNRAIRDALPVDTVNAGLETVLGWRHRAALDADLNGDGRTERLVVASDVSLTDSGEPLWEDGHRWGVYVEDSTQRTLLYSRFLPNGVAEIAVGAPGTDGSRDILILERTPQHSRSIVLEYQRPGSARPVSDANYPLEQWLPSLTSIRREPLVVRAGRTRGRSRARRPSENRAVRWRLLLELRFVKT
ncbi:MAG TPA: hypothetical protein VMM17_07935 [Gemmatimonadaceae bacterium]|nr:hypothetical protein [Gemmatimonadaceae bacterium]